MRTPGTMQVVALLLMAIAGAILSMANHPAGISFSLISAMASFNAFVLGELEIQRHKLPAQL